MTHHIDIQIATSYAVPLTTEQLVKLVELPLRNEQDDIELTLRLVDNVEMIYLNNSYRKQDKTTNVLAFPSSLPSDIELDCRFLGDVIICPEVLLAESKTQKKSLEEHWALIVMHGVLHLLGYDHINDKDAHIMQALEIKLLAELGYANPYDIEEFNLE